MDPYEPDLFGGRRRIFKTAGGDVLMEYTDEHLSEYPVGGFQLVFDVPRDRVLRLSPLTIVLFKQPPEPLAA